MQTVFCRQLHVPNKSKYASKRWNERCDLLEAYFDLLGTCNCLQNTVCIMPEGQNKVNLGCWLSYERARRTGMYNRMTPFSMEEETRLQELVNKRRVAHVEL